MSSICTQNFKSKFASLKIERLKRSIFNDANFEIILCIPFNAIENGIGEKILTANLFNETFVETCSFRHSALLENTITSNCWVRIVCNKC